MDCAEPGFEHTTAHLGGFFDAPEIPVCLSCRHFCLQKGRRCIKKGARRPRSSLWFRDKTLSVKGRCRLRCVSGRVFSLRVRLCSFPIDFPFSILSTPSSTRPFFSLFSFPPFRPNRRLSYRRCCLYRATNFKHLLSLGAALRLGPFPGRRTNASVFSFLHLCLLVFRSRLVLSLQLLDLSTLSRIRPRLSPIFRLQSSFFFAVVFLDLPQRVDAERATRNCPRSPPSPLPARSSFFGSPPFPRCFDATRPRFWRASLSSLFPRFSPVSGFSLSAFRQEEASWPSCSRGGSRFSSSLRRDRLASKSKRPSTHSHANACKDTH